MYQKIKEELKQKYYIDNYPSDGQRFIAWYLRNIHNLEPFVAKECITDGPGDKQIDAVYIDEQTSTIYIIQGKFYEGSKIDSEPLREVLSSWVQIKDIQALQESANDKLKAKIIDISEALDEEYEICFEFITTSSLTPSAKKDLESFNKELAENEQLNARIVSVANNELQDRYNEALNKSRPYINHVFNVDVSKTLEMTLSGSRVVIAAIPLKECIKIPGIKDGSLFRKNVRQSLGNSNKVNKEIARTLKEDSSDFFFFHNGITAICSEITIYDSKISVKGLNVVNGCQSLSTIFSCSETVKKSNDGYIMFRFYETSDTIKEDKISVSTNSQSAVKARDLRSNDKAVLSMKKLYEHRYTDGYFITKRGEKINSAKYNSAHIVNLTDLGKQLMAWYSQRPNISYSETNIFDKYFKQLFHKDYAPENVQALKELFDAVISKWNKDNPIGFHESLLAMKSYAPYHHLFTISVLFCLLNSKPDMVPNPQKALECLRKNKLLDTIVYQAGLCLNSAFERAWSNAKENNRIFSSQNWTKAKISLQDIKEAVKTYLGLLKCMPDRKETLYKWQSAMTLSPDDFEEIWNAD